MNGRETRRVAVLFAVLAAAGSALAATIRVPADQPTIADAIAIAQPGDIILVDDYVFFDEPIIDWLDKAVRVESTGNVDQPYDGLYKLGAGSTLTAATGGMLDVRGELRSPESGSADAHAAYLDECPTGRIVVQPGAGLNVSTSASVNLSGTVIVENAAALSFSLPLGEYLDTSGTVTLFDNAQLNITGGLAMDGALTGVDAVVTVGDQIDTHGSWILNGGALSTSDNLYTTSYAMLTLYGCELTVIGECGNGGQLRLFDGLLLTQHLTNYDQLDLFNVTLSAERFYNSSYNEVTGSGFWVTDLDNDGELFCTDDTTVVGDVENDGTITIYTGTLTIFGTLTNDGTIIGNYRGGRDGDDWQGISIGGDFIAGFGAQLLMPSPALRVRVDGDYDVAIGENERYDMCQATLMVGSLAGAGVELEVMSRDVGPFETGLDRTLPGHYPIGTLHIAGATVNLIDLHDNDNLGPEPCEAVYVDALQIDAGATVNTNGCRIYYNTLVNNGVVDQPENLILIESGIPGDLDGDGDVDLSDLAQLLSNYGITGGATYQQGDLDGDGDIDLNDLAALLANYGFSHGP